MNPIKFYDDIISDVISGDIALWAYEHDNWTIFHPISTKLGMVDGIWVQTNPIEKRLYLFILYSNNSIAEGLRRSYNGSGLSLLLLLTHEKKSVTCPGFTENSGIWRV